MELKIETIFLDRDGVINKESKNYIKNWREFDFIPNSIEAIKKLTQNNLDIFVITNQSGIGRKYFFESELLNIHKNMTEILSKNNGKIKDIFYCPHIDEDNCTCRKPKPGMIYKARELYNLDISKSCMIGDSLRDIESAKAARCGLCILVKTGNGENTEKALIEKNICIDYIALNLFDAVNWLLSRLNKI